VLIVAAGNRPDEPARSVPRLPVEHIDALASELVALLATLRPAAVVSAGAAGADLLVLGAAQSLGIAVHVVVPIAEAEFLRRSVADAGSEWVERWERVLAAARADAASAVHQGDLAVGRSWFLEANAQVLDVARRLAAAADEPVLAVAVRPPGGEDPPSATDDFVAKARAAGLVVVELDPHGAAGGPGAVRATVGPAASEIRGDASGPPCA
jgi:hypothetical protein